jgi:lactate permease
VPQVKNALSAAGLSYTYFVRQIGLWAAIPHALVGTFVPLMMVAMLTRFFGENRSFREGLAVWPYALFAGLCFTIPYVLTSTGSPEFPSLIGGLVGLAILVPVTRADFLSPKEKWDFPRLSSWPREWMGSIKPDHTDQAETISMWRAWIPYVLIGSILVLTRVDFLPFGNWTKALSIGYGRIGRIPISNSLEPLNLPGILPFMFVALLCIPLFKMKKRSVTTAWSEAGKRIISPAIALMFAIPMVRVMIQSGNTPLEWESMPLTMAHFVANTVRGAWPFFAPFIGALGAFMAGSNTVSDMLFGLFQYGVAERLGLPHLIILGMQAVGGAMGNMICVHNVVAACATVGLIGVEGLLIRRNLLPMMIYGIMAGIIGVLFAYVLFSHLF